MSSGSDISKGRSRMSSHSSCTGSTCSDGDTCTTSSSGEPNLPYPGFPEISLKYLTQDTKPRNWCLQLITNPYPFQMSLISFLYIFLFTYSTHLLPFSLIHNQHDDFHFEY
ncbi:uncharacterized protein DMENIID0001_043590 [Sergentomyia squamirostris]